MIARYKVERRTRRRAGSRNEHGTEGTSEHTYDASLARRRLGCRNSETHRGKDARHSDRRYRRRPHFPFCEVRHLASLTQHARDRDATLQILTRRENVAKVGSLGLDFVEAPLTEVAVARITSKWGHRGRLERATRIELAFSAWEADVLPLNYTRATSIVPPGPLAAQRKGPISSSDWSSASEYRCQGYGSLRSVH